MFCVLYLLFKNEPIEKFVIGSRCGKFNFYFCQLRLVILRTFCKVCKSRFKSKDKDRVGGRKFKTVFGLAR